jgi:hypothetical protein
LETWHQCILMYHIWLQILDYLFCHNDSALFRRAQLKALVSIHGKEVSSMKKTKTICKMEVMLWMSVAWKFWLSEICRFYVCLTRSQVTGWNPLEGFTKSSCGKLRLGSTLPASNSKKG